MKLKNIAKDVRALRDNGKFIEVEPGKTIEVERPVFNKKVFEVVNTKKSKEQIPEKDIVKKEDN